MAVAITIVLRIFGTGINNSVIAEDYSLGVQLAESLMAQTGVVTALEIGETRGQVGDKYDWVVTVRAVTQSKASKDMNQKSSEPTMFSVKVLVAWGDDDRSQRYIELDTLKTL